MRRAIKKRIWSLFLLIMLTMKDQMLYVSAQFPPGTLTAAGFPLTQQNAQVAAPNLGAYAFNHAAGIGAPAMQLQALSSLPTLPASSLQGLQGLQSLQQLQALQGLQRLGLGAAAPLSLSAGVPPSPFSSANTTFIPLGQVLIPTGKEVIQNSNGNGNFGNGGGFGSNCGNSFNNGFGGGGCGGNCGGGCCGSDGNCGGGGCCGQPDCGCCGGMGDCSGGNYGNYGQGRRRRKRSPDFIATLFDLIHKRISKNFNQTRNRSFKDGMYT